MKTTVKEIKRILSESDKHVVIGRDEMINDDAINLLQSLMDDEYELNIIEFDNYFAIWR